MGGPPGRFDNLRALAEIGEGGVEGGGFVVVPVVDVVEEAPDDFFVALNHLLFGPEVPSIKPFLLPEELQHPLEVGAHLSQFLRRSVAPLQQLLPPSEAVHQVEEEHAVSAVLGQVSLQGLHLLLTPRF